MGSDNPILSRDETNTKSWDLLGTSLDLNLNLGLVWIRFGFQYGFVEVAITNLGEEKLIYSLPNPNLFVRFVWVQTQIKSKSFTLNLNRI